MTANTNKYIKIKILYAFTLVISTHSFAQDNGELQDMSDPLAVFTQVGIGYTDRGLNLKIGQTYDTNSDTTLGMNVIEIKGFAGEQLGWNRRSVKVDDSIDSIRYRNFGIDLTNGRGSQVDVNLGFTADGTQGSTSYSFIQALPQMGPVSLYPLAGLGVAFGESYNDIDKLAQQVQDRWDIHGTFFVTGFYGKIEVTDKIWLNYNPMYMGTISGSDAYKNNGFGEGYDSILLHEVTLSYQISPRTNIRYYANWNEKVNFSNGSHRIEVNYQF